MRRTSIPLKGSKWAAIDDDNFIKNFQSGLRVSAPEATPRATPLVAAPVKPVQNTATPPARPFQEIPPQPLVDTTNQDSGKRKASGQPQQDLKAFLSDSMDIDRSSRENSQQVRSREPSGSMQWRATTPDLKPSSAPFVPMIAAKAEPARTYSSPADKWSEYVNKSSLPMEQIRESPTKHNTTTESDKTKTHHQNFGLLGSKYMLGSEPKLGRWEALKEREETIRRRIDEMTASKQGITITTTESNSQTFYQSQPVNEERPVISKTNAVVQAEASGPTQDWRQKTLHESWNSHARPAPSMASFDSPAAPPLKKGWNEQSSNASGNNQVVLAPSMSHPSPTSPATARRFKTVIPPPSSQANAAQLNPQLSVTPMARNEPARSAATQRTKTVIPPMSSTTAATSLESFLGARNIDTPTAEPTQYKPAQAQATSVPATKAVSYSSLPIATPKSPTPAARQQNVLSPAQAISPPALLTVAPTPAPSPVVHATARKNGRQKFVMNFPVHKADPIQIPATQPHVATQEGSPKKQRLSYEQSLIQDAKMPTFPPLEPSVSSVTSRGRGFQADHQPPATAEAAKHNAPPPVAAPATDPSVITSWPTPEARSYGPAEIRRVKLVNLPSSSTPSTLASLTYGGALEQVQYLPGSSSGTVLFLDPADCLEYFDKTANGIEFPPEVEAKLNRAAGVVGGAALVAQTRLLRTIWVEKYSQAEPVSGVVKQYIDKEFTRCVKAIGIEDSWSLEYLRQRAEGKGSAARKVEHVGIRVSERGVRIAEFRFCDINHAVRFKAEMTRDDDWEMCNLQFYSDPCAVARGLHFD